MKKNREAQDLEPAHLRSAFARFAGAYLGAFALAAVYLVAVVRGVTAPAALLRGGIAYVVFFFVGRILGSLLGRQFEKPRRLRNPAPLKEVEAAS